MKLDSWAVRGRRLGEFRADLSALEVFGDSVFWNANLPTTESDPRMAKSARGTEQIHCGCRNVQTFGGLFHI